jgi:pyrroline-5-carboxylate reductase
MKIGYLGVGAIAFHMVEGFCGLGLHEFNLSPRNAEKSALLAKQYNNVAVCGSNQQVVDDSDIIFISMNASSCPQALEELTFGENKTIINLVATIPPEEILAAIGKVRNFYHIVPLPFISQRIGPIAAYPFSDELQELLSPLGTVVFAENMNEIRAMQAITALMSSFYETLHGLALFAENEGMEYKKAMSYTASFFGALCRRAGDFGGGDFNTLAMEMTPGGLNEFCLGTLGDLGVIEAWAKILPHVMKKIKK